MMTEEQTRSETVRLGKERYERDIRAIVEADPANRGKMLAVDVQTGAYAVGDDIWVAVEKLKASVADPEPFAVRIGSPYAFRIGYGAFKR